MCHLCYFVLIMIDDFLSGIRLQHTDGPCGSKLYLSLFNLQQQSSASRTSNSNDVALLVANKFVFPQILFLISQH